VTIERKKITPKNIGGNMHNSYISGRDRVSLFKAVQVQQERLCHVGDYIAYKNEGDEVTTQYMYVSAIIINLHVHLQLEYGLLAANVKNVDTCCYCVLQKFSQVCVGEVPVVNEIDCPLLEADTRFEVIPSTSVLGAISIIHECTSSCRLQPSRTVVVERECTSTNTEKNFLS